MSLAGANGLLELPASTRAGSPSGDGKDRLDEGETVPCVMIGEMMASAAVSA